MNSGSLNRGAFGRECRVRVAEEVRPVPSEPIPIVYGARRAGDGRRAASPRKPRRHQSPSASASASASLMGRKYVAYQVDDLKASVSTSQGQRTVYGTLTAGGKGKACSPPRPEEEEETLLLLPTTSPTGADCSSNQSETESDSDSGSSNSAGSSVAAAVASAASSSLQSILRIRSGDFSCRRVRKQASVEFAIDILSDEDEELAPLRRKKTSRACSSRCVPRRLTIEEKTALYRVRPDLELTPTPVLLLELEETRRRKQRKLVFSVLGAALVLLMIIVFYYTVSQMDED